MYGCTKHSKNLELNCLQFFETITSGMLFGNIQYSRTTLATCAAVTFETVIGFMNLNYRSVITTINWLQLFVEVKVPSILIATTSASGLQSRISFKSCRCLSNGLCNLHDSHWLTYTCNLTAGSACGTVAGRYQTSPMLHGVLLAVVNGHCPALIFIEFLALLEPYLSWMFCGMTSLLF